MGANDKLEATGYAAAFLELDEQARGITDPLDVLALRQASTRELLEELARRGDGPLYGAPESKGRWLATAAGQGLQVCTPEMLAYRASEPVAPVEQERPEWRACR